MLLKFFRKYFLEADMKRLKFRFLGMEKDASCVVILWRGGLKLTLKVASNISRQ